MQTMPYSIKADVARRLVTITFAREFWVLDVADRFKSEILAAVASLRCVPGQHLVLVDLRSAVLQSKEVYEKMQALVGASTAHRIALVASTPLARMQTKRLQLRDNIVMFPELADAEEWLFASAQEAA